MTAWTKWPDQEPPRDKPILFRMPEWHVPACIEFDQDEDGTDYWFFCEEVMALHLDPLEAEDLATGEWALIPE